MRVKLAGYGSQEWARQGNRQAVTQLSPVVTTWEDQPRVARSSDFPEKPEIQMFM